MAEETPIREREAIAGSLLPTLIADKSLTAAGADSYKFIVIPLKGVHQCLSPPRWYLLQAREPV